MTYDFTAAAKHFAARNAFTTGPHELAAMIEANRDIVIVDVRYPGDFRASHIPGAVNLPVVDDAEFAEHLATVAIPLVRIIAGRPESDAAFAADAGVHQGPVVRAPQVEAETLRDGIQRLLPECQ